MKWAVPARRAPPLSSQGLAALCSAGCPLALSPLILLVGPAPEPQDGRRGGAHGSLLPPLPRKRPAVGRGLCCPKGSVLPPALGPAPPSLQHLLKEDLAAEALADAGSGMWARPAAATQHSLWLVGTSQSWVLRLLAEGGEGVKVGGGAEQLSKAPAALRPPLWTAVLIAPRSPRVRAESHLEGEAGPHCPLMNSTS